MNKTKDSFFVLDTDLAIITMKPETCEMLGYECRELIDQPLKKIVAEKCYPRLKWALEQTRHHRSLFRRVYYRSRDGRNLRIDYYLFNTFKEGREIFVGIAERANMPADVMRHCTGRTRPCKEIRALYNIGRLTHKATTSEEVLRGVVSNLAWAIDHPQLTATRIIFDGNEYLGSPRRPRVGGRRITSDLTIEGRKRGEIEFCRLKPTLPFTPEKQQLLSEISGTVSRFLYRKEMEKRLVEYSIRLKSLFDAITDLLFTISADFTIKVINKDMEVIGQKCYQAFYRREEPCQNCPAVIVQQTLQPGHTEKWDGNRVFNLSAYPVTDPNGDLTDLVVRSREITQQKNIEQQLIEAGKLASIGELVSGIAHEINNPNTFIRGNTSFIAEAFETILPLLDRIKGEDPDFKIARLPYPYFRSKITTLVSDMQEGADHITNIISDLRQFARPDDNSQDEDVAINEVIDICRRLVQNQIERTAELHLDLAPDLPTFKGNIQKTEQVIVNIIINASQAIEEKQKMGNIWIRTFLGKDDKIHIHIRDDGVGMPPEVKERLFNPFFTTKRNRHGTGLGLSIAYGIVKSFKGVILADSRPDEGSEFKIVIPPKPGRSVPQGNRQKVPAEG
ncbi:MAG: ATP-binding protein [bacterium]|nr:ATP-binding protein [bacterium]